MKTPVSSAAAAHGVAVQIKQLQRIYGERAVLQDISLGIAPGEVLALLGPSGCGKTTLLKILAGLEQPSSGELWMGGQCVASAGSSLAPEARDLGMVFQDYALWPHMSVAANVAFPLEMRGLARSQIRERVQQTLALVGLLGLGPRAPSSLSGGQQQRVALARAIVARPRLVLFDEPLSNLDRDLRESLCLEMSQLLRSLGCTAVYVTHDHEEACVMADRVAVMMQGRIQQLDAPQALWSTPAHCDVAQFLKLGAIVPARREGGQWMIARQPLPSDLRPMPAAPAGDPLPGARAARVLVPHAALQLGGAARPAALRLQAQVLSQQYRCGQFHTLVQSEWDVPLQLACDQRLAPRAMVEISVDARRLQWFAAA
nr:ABC transporter ATP-binding protein [Comamonas composti]